MNNTRGSADLLKREQNMAMAHKACSPIFWSDSAARDGITSGTVTFVKVDQKVFGLTAGHVADGHKHFADGGGTACRLGNADFTSVGASFHYHPCFPAIDLAICHFDESKLGEIGVEPFLIIGCPLPLPVIGQNIALGGFPGQDRMNRNTEVDFDFFYYDGHVAEIEDQRIQISIQRETSTPMNCAPLTEPIQMAGMSGGPIFGYFQTKTGAQLALIGLITRGFDAWETVVCTPLTSLNALGRFY